MEIFDIIKKLVDLGNEVDYRPRMRKVRIISHGRKEVVRRQEGYLITRINGVKFTGASGNKVARALTGNKLSEAREKQLKTINTPTYIDKRRKSPITDKEIMKQFKRTQRKWNKNVDVSKGKKTIKKLRYSLSQKSKFEVMEDLTQAERYATGKAYSKNIDILRSRVEEMNIKGFGGGDDNLSKIQKLIEDNPDMTDNQLNKVYEIMYKLNRSQERRITTEQAYKEVYDVLS